MATKPMETSNQMQTAPNISLVGSIFADYNDFVDKCYDYTSILMSDSRNHPTLKKQSQLSPKILF